LKTGNVILAIFLWLCIPASFFLGGIFGIVGGGIGGGAMCAIGAPLILFILGLVALITGMEKPSVQPIQPVVVEKHQYEHKDISEKEKPVEKEIDEELEEKTVKTKYCFQCGNKLEGIPKFCSKCGTKLR